MTPHASYPERLKWAEEQGLKNLQEKFTTADNMNKEAQTTLTYVLAAMGVTGSYVFQGLNGPMDWKVALAAMMCLYYTGLGFYLVRQTLFIGSFPSPYQEPQNLTRDPPVALDDVREAEIRNIAKRIGEAKTWIEDKSEAVNQVRFLLVMSPVILVVGVGVCYSIGLITPPAQPVPCASQCAAPKPG